MHLRGTGKSTAAALRLLSEIIEKPTQWHFVGYTNYRKDCYFVDLVWDLKVKLGLEIVSKIQGGSVYFKSEWYGFVVDPKNGVRAKATEDDYKRLR